MGKIFDDFHSISFRGFYFIENNPSWLQKMKEDIFFVMTEKALEKFQIQFHDTNQNSWAVEYEVKSDGSIFQDSESGGIDYWEIPANASINIIMDRDVENKKVTDYLNLRGWGTGGQFVEGDFIDDGAYSKNGFGTTKGRRGAWK
jgi:hypothetical protein